MSAKGRFRDLDAGGELESAGFFWVQPIPHRFEFRKYFLMSMAYPLLLTGPFTIWIFEKSFFSFKMDLPSLFLVLHGLCSVPIIVAAFLPFSMNWLYESAGLKFGRDGSIAYYAAGKQLLWDRRSTMGWVELGPGISQITSIGMDIVRNRVGGHFAFEGEFFETEYLAYQVRAFAADGSAVAVCYCVAESTARIVTEQLNQAMVEIAGGYRE
jgi:hypothetical protein